MSNTVNPPPATTVQRQIRLPLSKAVEIAYKSIRLRLSRSLLVTSGIILALAFLMSIQANDAFINGMRTWITHAERTPQFDAYRAQVKQLGEKQAELEKQLRPAAVKAPKPPAGATAFNAEARYGVDLPALQKELGVLPGPRDGLQKALTAEPALLSVMDEWVASRRQQKAVVEKLNGPQNLESLLKQSGQPTSAAEIENDKIQTRWLLGLALLVAFVGILNSMLMSVTERFREIGTMKCLGALDGFIIKLFLIESLFQGLVGTILGIIVGLLLSIVAMSAGYGHYAWVMVPWSSLGISIALSMLVGVGLTVAGAVYPAWQAARMQPIEAMRVET